MHRDVSLQNVLLSYDGAVKLTDFGIAMSAENRARTEAGIVKGKFGYMSPEQIRGELMDRRSDVFATGICLYELLTGERLFSGETDYAAVEKVRNVAIEPPSRLNREIPSALEQIVMKALVEAPARPLPDRGRAAPRAARVHGREPRRVLGQGPRRVHARAVRRRHRAPARRPRRSAPTAACRATRPPGSPRSTTSIRSAR